MTKPTSIEDVLEALVNEAAGCICLDFPNCYCNKAQKQATSDIKSLIKSKLPKEKFCPLITKFPYHNRTNECRVCENNKLLSDIIKIVEEL